LLFYSLFSLKDACFGKQILCEKELSKIKFLLLSAFFACKS
jgi:hypothetical protein